MKKRTKRFDVGGDVRERAMKFAALADNPEGQAAFQRNVQEFQQREAEMADLIRNAERRNAARASAPKVSSVAAGRFTDSDVEERAGQRAVEEAENMARIEAARNARTAEVKPSPRLRAAEPVEIIGEVEEVREPRNRASSIPSMESQRMEEKTTGERIRDVVGRGGATDIRNIAGALVGPAAGRVAAAAARGASEASGSAGAQRVMDAATRRAAQVRAEKAAEAAPTREILRGTQQTETARRAAETRERAMRKAQETMGRGTARTRARAAERRQDALDEMRMGGEGGGFKKGGKISASSRADGIAVRGKTRGRLV